MGTSNIVGGIASGAARGYERERQRVGAPEGTPAKMTNKNTTGNMATYLREWAEAPKFEFEGYPARSSSSDAAKSAPATKSGPTKARPGRRVRSTLNTPANTAQRTLLGN